MKNKKNSIFYIIVVPKQANVNTAGYDHTSADNRHLWKVNRKF